MTKITIDIEQVKRVLTMKEALELLSPHLEKRKKRIHTFTNGGPILMGCDVDLTSIKKRLKLCKEDDITLSGPHMRAMGHGVAFWDDKEGWMFLESDRTKIDAIHKERKIK